MKEIYHNRKLMNGVAAAAILAGALGWLVLSLGIVLAEASPAIKKAFTLWNPAGPLSGKTTFGVLIWLLSWALLHWIWKNKQVHLQAILTLSYILLALGWILSFPPFFELFTQH